MNLPNRKNARLNSAYYNQSGAFFITICTMGRKKILSRICGGTSILDRPHVQLMPHGTIAEKYIHQLDAFYENLSVDNYVIMPDHIHFLISISYANGHPGTGAPTKRTSVIARFVGTFKRFCNIEYGENIWQARYYDHIVRNRQDYDEIWQYIENNPRNSFLRAQGNSPSL